ncbi:hypothetical protein AQUCO_03400031v1 [Aquilegia coerulea]|uniref:dCTP pyrophosphatase 1 n=1 Tax=Aquilegia coerulea TaxID=218851 RepID=A0A2G5CY64_AQUCA|nr:hypothetical protein AQUCO_03400031v1 [Aquilegia coerulea]
MNGGAEKENVSLEDLRKIMANFARERNWEQYHSPRELSEIFQWKGEVPKGLPDWKEEEKIHLGEELSDVLLYLVQLSNMCGIDLGKAALRKVQLNALKYPVPISKDSSNKQNINNNNLGMVDIKVNDDSSSSTETL